MMKIIPFLLLLLSIFEISEAGFRDVGFYESLSFEEAEKGGGQQKQQTGSSSTTLSKKDFHRKLAKLVASHRNLDGYDDPPHYSPDYQEEEESPEYKDDESELSGKSSKASKSSKSSKGSSGKYYSSSDYYDSDGDHEDGYGHRAGDNHYHGPGTLDFVIVSWDFC